jgi:hypothetical protein
VVAEHLHQRMLDQLPRRPGCQQRLALRCPGGSDGVTAGNSLPVAALGLRKTITAHENGRATSSENDLAGRGASEFWPLPTPAPLVPRRELQLRWAGRMLSTLSAPPRDRGMMWSAVSGSVGVGGLPQMKQMVANWTTMRAARWCAYLRGVSACNEQRLEPGKAVRPHMRQVRLVMLRESDVSLARVDLGQPTDGRTGWRGRGGRGHSRRALGVTPRREGLSLEAAGLGAASVPPANFGVNGQAPERKNCRG